MPDIHRHDEHSLFDGYGKPLELANLAKSLGYTSLGIANHGVVSGLVQHSKACEEVGIKPILGVEAYFKPVFSKESSTYHLCLFAKNVTGYSNMMNMMTEAEKNFKYYKPMVTFELLEKYHEGLICASGCIAGLMSQDLRNGNDKRATKAAQKFKNIFGDDFYIEIQPYGVWDKDGAEIQKGVNEKLIALANELDISCILTSDSHYGKKEDWETYLKMHEIGQHKYDIKATYGERYMPTYKELWQRFKEMHYDLDGAPDFGKEMIQNLKELDSKVEDGILKKLPLKLPKADKSITDSTKALQVAIQEGMKRTGKTSKAYLDRVKEEFSVIKAHGFEDYFLIVADYVKWAKDNDIEVGPGRGSVCNCQIAYFLDITTVDSLKFDLDFRRFLRMDKKKLPDIDLDFETSRRQEVIEYIINKYEGHACQIASYGLYRVDNLINDLVKVCNCSDVDEIKSIKKFINANIIEDDFDYEKVSRMSEARMYNKTYDNIILHFSKLFRKIRYIGTHAAGVAITGGNISDYIQVKISKDKEVACFDLNDIEHVNVVKFDILGLKTCESTGELRRMTGVSYDEAWLDDERLLRNFGEGNTDGIFQFERNSVKKMLQDIECDCFDDAVAASSMNRPGPLQLGMPQQYARNKLEGVTKDEFYEYTKETYGTLIYQEQLQQVCVNIGKMTWEQADKVMKSLKNVGIEALRIQLEKDKEELTRIFVKGAMESGITEERARDMFQKVLVYSFNKGHAVGYTIISFQEMYYKVYHPTEFWYAKIKHANKDADIYKYMINAAKQEVLILLAHVNYTAGYSMRELQGEMVIQQGLIAIKGVGEKACASIELERLTNGPFKSYDDFVDRCKNRSVHTGVIRILKEYGSLEFDKKMYEKRVIKFNTALYGRS